jgi:hypothetical protein
MTTTRVLRSILLAFGIVFFASTAATNAHAQDASSQKEAGVHFQRAVQLYSEADYRAALVEFKRAYELAPNVTVLYNLGETYYQLQQYAEALTTFERFLAEGGTQHKQEVENAVSVLKTRVGKLDITTPSPGWEISVDDEVVGKTPLAKPIAVSIGRRRLGATKAGEASVTRLVEVAAGETAAINLAGIGGAAKPADGTDPQAPPAGSDHGGNGLLIAGWVGTGALAAGAVVTGILATSKSSSLKDARTTFPANKADLDSKASSVKSLALVTDILGASAVILGGVTLYFTLTKPSSTTTARLGTSGSRLLLEGTF